MIHATNPGIYRERIKASAATLTLGGREVTLLDVSMSGFAVEIHDNSVEDTIDSVHEMALTLDYETLYEGPARVVRFDADAKHAALTVLSGFIDVPRLADKLDRLQIRAEAQGYDAARSLVPTDYRLAIEGIADLHRFYRRLFGDREATLAQQGARSESALATLTQIAFDLIRPRWQALRDAAAEAAGPYLGDAHRVLAMKRQTERVVTMDLLNAPLIERAYRKPLGYGGDYRTMMYLYDDAFVGPTVVDRVFHRIFAAEALAEGVRRRKDLLKRLTREEHARTVAERGTAAITRVTSIGCGPALEVFELGREDTWEGAIHWTLVDQESRALSVAYNEIYPVVRGPTASSGEIRCLNLPLRRVLKEEKLLPEEPQDFIYASGLFDYLDARVARMLIQFLSRKIAPGGLIAIGNARRDPLNFWTTEFVCDWSLIYRTQAEMHELGAGLGPDFTCELVQEAARAYWFLLIRRAPANVG
jgi:hypothetical protein